MGTILIADDSLFIRSIMKDVIKETGHTVVGEAVNGREAVEKYKKLMPDLITMDIVMPELNGIEAVKLIMEEDPSANIVMVSALGQERMVKNAISAGAKDFIVKPFDREKAVSVFEKLINEKKDDMTPKRLTQ